MQQENNGLHPTVVPAQQENQDVLTTSKHYSCSHAVENKYVFATYKPYCLREVDKVREVQN